MAEHEQELDVEQAGRLPEHLRGEKRSSGGHEPAGDDGQGRGQHDEGRDEREGERARGAEGGVGRGGGAGRADGPPRAKVLGDEVDEVGGDAGPIRVVVLGGEVVVGWKKEKE